MINGNLITNRKVCRNLVAIFNDSFKIFFEKFETGLNKRMNSVTLMSFSFFIIDNCLKLSEYYLSFIFIHDVALCFNPCLIFHFLLNFIQLLKPHTSIFISIRWNFQFMCAYKCACHSRARKKTRTVWRTTN